MKKVLVLGGTRLFGKHLVEHLLKFGYKVTIATRGIRDVEFSEKVNKIVFDRYNEQSIVDVFSQKNYDIVYDNLAYSSNDIKILLPHIKYSKYIVISSTAVYEPLEGEVREDDFDVKKIIYKNELRDKNRYAYGKRLVEAAIHNEFKNENIILVRFPYVIGKDDYTKRLQKYIESYIRNQEMYIDNLYDKMSFISSEEAGEFLASLSDIDFRDAINASSEGQIFIYDILKKTSCLEENNNSIFTKKIKNLYCKESVDLTAPYNNTRNYVINTDKAKKLGYSFTNINDWVDDLILYYYRSLTKYK